MTNLHPFERAGLGKAPFRCYGVVENWYSAGPGHKQPGGSCDYCGTGIAYEYLIRGSDEREFKVGCDCVRKTGAQVAGFREQRLQLAHGKREARRKEQFEERRARWAREDAERAGVFQLDSTNRSLVTWLEQTPEGATGFRAEMLATMRHRGFLTDRQRDAARGMMARQAERDRVRERSAHVGVVGKPVRLEFRIEHTHSFESSFGWPRKMVHINILRSGDDVVVYKGNQLGDRGERLSATFTVKEHGERDGVRQTIVARPRNIETKARASADEEPTPGDEDEPVDHAYNNLDRADKHGHRDVA
jgi:hypothetical protein